MIEVALYGLLAMPLSVDASAANPYDPAVVRVDAVVTTPDATTTWPCFFDGEQWQLRYRPVVAGEHAVSVEVDGVASQSLSFRVVDEGLPGPIHPDGYGFRRADGSPFVPLGPNLGWSAGGGTDDYAAWFAAIAASGGTFARIWVTHFTSQNPWWSDLERIDPVAADNLDAILDHAHDAGIGVMLVLWQHSQLPALAWSSWNDNPYNAANGGPCATATCFFADAAAQEPQERFLRYAVARYGAHPALLSWEVMNEVDGVQGVDTATAVRWAEARAAWLREAEGGLHPVSWSTSRPSAASDWAGADFAQVHSYQGVDVALLAEGVRLSIDDAPVLVGEWGLDWFGHLDGQDTDGVGWHDANWAALASGSAGGAMTWWWDGHIAPDDLWWRLEGPAAVVADLDLPAMGPVAVDVTGAYLEAWARADDATALVWVHDRGHLPPDPETGPVTGATVSLPTMPHATFTVRDTSTGAVLAEERVCGEPFALPKFTGDVALVARDATERCEAACGCHTGPPGASPLALLAALALRRRRPVSRPAR